jgi:hypothetical protein
MDAHTLKPAANLAKYGKTPFPVRARNIAGRARRCLRKKSNSAAT